MCVSSSYPTGTLLCSTFLVTKWKQKLGECTQDFFNSECQKENSLRISTYVHFWVDDVRSRASKSKPIIMWNHKKIDFSFTVFYKEDSWPRNKLFPFPWKWSASAIRQPPTQQSLSFYTVKRTQGWLYLYVIGTLVKCVQLAPFMGLEESGSGAGKGNKSVMWPEGNLGPSERVKRCSLKREIILVLHAQPMSFFCTYTYSLSSLNIIIHFLWRLLAYANICEWLLLDSLTIWGLFI